VRKHDRASPACDRLSRGALTTPGDERAASAWYVQVILESMSHAQQAALLACLPACLPSTPPACLLAFNAACLPACLQRQRSLWPRFGRATVHVKTLAP
jgi:hypothetical protein